MRRRRLLELCLLAYPRLRRDRDREYLRDLALELSETYGLRRQAMSLLGGGLRERLEALRLSRGAGLSVGTTRVVVVCLLLGTVALAVSSLPELAAGSGERREADRFACVRTGQPHSPVADAPMHSRSGCAQEKGLVAARLRAGWHCGRQERRRVIAWRCSLAEGAEESVGASTS